MKKFFISLCLMILCVNLLIISKVDAENISDILGEEAPTTVTTTIHANSNYDGVPYEFIDLDSNFLLIIEGIFVVMLIISVIRKKTDGTITALLIFSYIIFMLWLILSGKYESLLSIKFILISMIVFPVVLIIIHIVLKKIIYKMKKDEYKRKKVLTQYEIDKIDSSIDGNEIIHDAFNLYINIQKEFVNFNLDNLKRILSRDLFDKYSKQIDKLKIDGLREEVSNFQFIDGGVIAIKKLDEKIEFVVKLVLDMNVKILNNNEVVRENKYDDVSILIKFEKNLFVKLEKCSNCGKDLYFEKLSKCPNCEENLVGKIYIVTDIKL